MHAYCRARSGRQSVNSSKTDSGSQQSRLTALADKSQIICLSLSGLSTTELLLYLISRNYRLPIDPMFCAHPALRARIKRPSFTSGHLEQRPWTTPSGGTVESVRQISFRILLRDSWDNGRTRAAVCQPQQNNAPHTPSSFGQGFQSPPFSSAASIDTAHGYA